MVYVALDKMTTIGKFGRGWRRLVGHGRSSRESVPFSKNVPLGERNTVFRRLWESITRDPSVEKFSTPAVNTPMDYHYRNVGVLFDGSRVQKTSRCHFF